MKNKKILRRWQTFKKRKKKKLLGKLEREKKLRKGQKQNNKNLLID